MVVFTLFVIEPGQWVSFAVVVVAGILTFIPINFIHPVRVVRLRPINLTMTLLWCAFGALALAQAALAAFYDQIGVLGAQVSTFIKIGITITGLYLACIGGIMLLFFVLGCDTLIHYRIRLIGLALTNQEGAAKLDAAPKLKEAR